MFQGQNGCFRSNYRWKVRIRGVRILLTRCNRIVHKIWHYVSCVAMVLELFDLYDQKQWKVLWTKTTNNYKINNTNGLSYEDFWKIIILKKIWNKKWAYLMAQRGNDIFIFQNILSFILIFRFINTMRTKKCAIIIITNIN